jgi:hypothetical protein
MKRDGLFWLDWIEERAAILEYEAGMSREDANREARRMMREYAKELKQWDLTHNLE